MDLKTALREEATKFAERVHDLMIAQLTSALGATTTSAPAPAERSVASTAPKAASQRKRLAQEVVEEALAQIIKVLEQSPGGLRSEQIRTKLRMDKKLFQYAAHLGKTSDQLAQSGERRTTVYSVPVRPSRAQEEGRVVRKKKRG